MCRQQICVQAADLCAGRWFVCRPLICVQPQICVQATDLCAGRNAPSHLISLLNVLSFFCLWREVALPLPILGQLGWNTSSSQFNGDLMKALNDRWWPNSQLFSERNCAVITMKSFELEIRSAALAESVGWTDLTNAHLYVLLYWIASWDITHLYENVYNINVCINIECVLLHRVFSSYWHSLLINNRVYSSYWHSLLINNRVYSSYWHSLLINNHVYSSYWHSLLINNRVYSSYWHSLLINNRVYSIVIGIHC